MTPEEEALQRLAEAASGWGEPLSPEKLERLRRFAEDVRSSSPRANLTAPDDLKTILLRHLADGIASLPVLRRLAAAKVPPSPERGRSPRAEGAGASPSILDLGAGAGYIGMAVKTAWPEATVTLMEAREKRFAFLSGAAARMGSKGLKVVRHRAGEGGRFDGLFDIVVERALAKPPEALALALPMLKPGGCLAAYLSEPSDEGLAAPSARLIECHRYRLPEEDKDRFIAVFKKSGEEE